MTTPSRFARALITEQRDATLDLDDCVGQRQATFEFDLIDIRSGYRTQVHPLRDFIPTLSHDTSRTIKRQITGLWFDVETTAMVNVVSSRLEIFMVIASQRFPLGRYVFNNQTRFQSTAGKQSSIALYDEGFIVDQKLERGYPIAGVVGNVSVEDVLNSMLDDLPITVERESSPYTTVGSWTAGTSRGYAVEQLALDGDYFSPWFSNTYAMRFIRTFDPALVVPTFDLDLGNRVLQSRVIESDDLLDAPNRFTVISNGVTTVPSVPAVGTYDVPASAPHSIANRGFVVPDVVNRQLQDNTQAATVAQNLGLRQTIFERIELETPPDPRHDSYDVLRWQGENWLELAWTMPLIEGSSMTHLARKAYTP